MNVIAIDRRAYSITLVRVPIPAMLTSTRAPAFIDPTPNDVPQAIT
jgi:hypothetical protein